MMDVKRTNPNGGRSILVPPKATIKFETAAGPKFGPGPEAVKKPAAIQRAGSRQRSAGKDSPHGPDSGRVGTSDSGISVSSAGEALLHRRGSGTGEPLLFRRGSGNSVSLLPDPGIALAGASDAVFEPVVAPLVAPTQAPGIATAGIGIAAITAEEALSIPDTPPPLMLFEEGPKVDNFSAVAAQHEDIQLSDAVLEAFMQNSPSRTSLLHSPHSHLKQTPAVTHMAKLRVVEEMSRIQQRAFVTEQQRAQLMQTALSMDAPKLARRIIQDEKDHDEAVAMPAPRGIAEGQHEHEPVHSASAVSFLTAGELLMIDRRILEEKLADELTNNDNSYSESAKTANNDLEIDENEVTIKRTKSFRKREELQTQEDGRFAKAVEEVERIRQRFIAKAQLPILGSVSNVEKVTTNSSVSTMNVDLAAARDIYNNIHHNMSTSTSNTHVGAKVRKTGNGMLFSSRGSFHIDDAPSFAGDLARHSGYSSGGSGSSSGNISRQNSKRSDKYATHSSTNTTSSGSDKLAILHPDDTNSNSNYPPLSPAKPNAFPKRQGSYNNTSNTLSPKVDNISSADSVSSRDSHRSHTSNGSNFPNYPSHNMHVLNTIPDSPSTKSIRHVPLLNSGSIENLNPYHNYSNTNNTNNTNTTTNAQYDAAPYVNPFEAFERASAARIVKVGTFENPSEDELGATKKGNKQLTRKHSAKTSQQMVADDIDDLIGSRFNTARDPEEPQDPGEILGNSLVLLQQQLDVAAYNKPQQYSRNVSNNHTLEGKESIVGGSGANEVKPKLSTAAATAVATLSRPASAGRRHPNAASTNNANDLLSIHITHSTPPVHSPNKLPHLEVEPHNPRHYRDQRSVGSGRGSVGSERSDGRPGLHSDESTSSIGSAMFAFRLDSKSTDTPASARRDYPNRDPHNTSSDTPSPTHHPLGSGSADRGSGSASKYGNEVSRGLFQDHMHALHDNDTSPKPINSVRSTDSNFSYADYMYQSSNDSSRLPSNYIDHHATLAPLHAVGSIPSINTNMPVTLETGLHKPRTPQLQPLPTPTILPQPSATPTDSANSSVSGKRAQRATLARLSSFGLHNADEMNPLSNKNSDSSTATNIPSTRNTTLSTRNSTLAPRTLSRTRNTIATPTNSALNNSSAYNAKIRSAQMLLTSPLSDWLSVGASAIHNGTIHNGTNPALPHIEEENHRRSQKFTFDELHQADSLLRSSDSPAVSPSRNKANATHNATNHTAHNPNGTIHNMGRSGASLTSLLPSLTQSTHTVDPTALQNVYRSLNVLNSHFSNINSASASSNTTNQNSTANLPHSTTTNPNTPLPNTSPNANVKAIDQELDDLLAGNSIPATPRSDPSPDPLLPTTNHTNIAYTTNTNINTGEGDVYMQNKSRPNSRGPRVRTTTNLISQSTAAAPTLGAAAVPPLQRPSTSGGGSTANTPTIGTNGTTVSAGSDSTKYQTNMSSLTLGDSNVKSTDSVSGSITGVDKLSTPVHRELESVISHAKRRSLDGKSVHSGSTASTVNVQVRHANNTNTGVNNNNELEGADSANNSGSTTSNNASSINTHNTSNTNNTNNTTNTTTSTPAESQAQRLGALAAAFEAGDAVGKLMAQMMLMRNNGDASLGNNHSGGSGGSGGIGSRRA